MKIFFYRFYPFYLIFKNRIRNLLRMNSVSCSRICHCISNPELPRGQHDFNVQAPSPPKFYIKKIFFSNMPLKISLYCPFSKYRYNAEKPVFFAKICYGSETWQKYRSLCVVFRNARRIFGFFFKKSVKSRKPVFLPEFKST